MTDQDKIVIATTTANIVISGAVLWFITLWTSRWNDKRSLRDELDSIIKLAIENPYFENQKFTDSWRPNFEGDSNEDKLQKYELYCHLLFNHLSRLCEHHRYSKRKIENHLAIKEWVILHKKYWKDTSYENSSAYDSKFIKLINEYLT